MKRFNLFICTLLMLLCCDISAQNLTLKEGLSRIPFSKMPYKDRYLPVGYTDGCLINIYEGIEGKMYDDLQCKQYSLAKGNLDFTPEVYLKITLPNGLYLGSLSFGGCTDYRTDVLFVSDVNGKVKDTLECCVLNGDLAVKQYEVKSADEIIVYQMIFALQVPMKWEDYCATTKALIGRIRKTTYRISSEGKFVKVSEQDTTQKGFASFVLQEHNLWEPEAFNMSY